MLLWAAQPHLLNFIIVYTRQFYVQCTQLCVYRSSLLTFLFLGAMRFHECPYEEELPLFLVLEGFAIILKSGIGIIGMCVRRSREENERHCLDTINDILSLFLVLWTLTGLFVIESSRHIQLKQNHQEVLLLEVSQPVTLCLINRMSCHFSTGYQSQFTIWQDIRLTAVAFVTSL